MTCIPNLELKMGIRCLPEGRLERLTSVSRHVAELVNLPPHSADPYVGQSAFAHKGGLHTSALGKAGGATYEHIEPEAVGNGTRVLVSDLGGRAGMVMKAKELGVDLDDRAAAKLSDDLKQLEAEGFVFEAADASLELLMRQATGWSQDYFRVEGYRATTYHRAPVPGSDTPAIDTEATVKVWVGDERLIAVGEGNGPVNALDHALRNLLVGAYPQLAHIHLTDYRVRILDTEADTDAVVRVLIDSTDGDRAWTTIGVSTNIIEACWQALTDALVWGLRALGAVRFGGDGRARARPRRPHQARPRLRVAAPASRVRGCPTGPARWSTRASRAATGSATKGPTRATPCGWPGSSRASSPSPRASTRRTPSRGPSPWP